MQADFGKFPVLPQPPMVPPRLQRRVGLIALGRSTAAGRETGPRNVSLAHLKCFRLCCKVLKKTCILNHLVNLLAQESFPEATFALGITTNKQGKSGSMVVGTWLMGPEQAEGMRNILVLHFY